MDFIPPALCSTTERAKIRARGPKFVPLGLGEWISRFV
jgi:hypothetical protein